jgi:heat shock protein HslJ
MNSRTRRFGTALVLGLALVACNTQKKPMQPAASPPPPDNLHGTQWSLQDLGGKPVIANSRATLAFLAPGKVAGNGSCNRFSGSAEINGAMVKFGPLVATRMMCEPDASNQETEYLKALEGAQRFEVRGGRIYLLVNGTEKPLVFHRAS